jgi:hypothetical protein
MDSEKIVKNTLEANEGKDKKRGTILGCMDDVEFVRKQMVNKTIGGNGMGVCH